MLTAMMVLPAMTLLVLFYIAQRLWSNAVIFGVLLFLAYRWFAPLFCAAILMLKYSMIVSDHYDPHSVQARGCTVRERKFLGIKYYDVTCDAPQTFFKAIPVRFILNHGKCWPAVLNMFPRGDMDAEQLIRKVVS